MKRTLILCLAGIAGVLPLSLFAAPTANANNSGCYAHRPRYVEGVFEVRYDAGCSGHDEPELDPLLFRARIGTGIDVDGVLPSDGLSRCRTLGQRSGSEER